MAIVHIASSLLGVALFACGVALFDLSVGNGLYLAPVGCVVLIVATATKASGPRAMTASAWETRARTAGWSPSVGRALWWTLTVLEVLMTLLMVVAVVRG